MPYTRNGNPQPDTGFTVNDVVYPSGWIANPANKSQWSGLGIAEVAGPKPYDQRFYWGYDEDDKIIEKELDDKDAVDDDGNKLKDEDGDQVITYGLKTVWKRIQSDAANGILSSSDWMVVREAEGGTALPSTWKTYRAAVRTKCNERQTQIAGVSSTTKLKELVDAPAKVIDPSNGNTVDNTDPFLALWPDAPKS